MLAREATTDVVPIPGARVRAPRWVHTFRRQRYAITTWIVALVLSSALIGIPTTRELVLGWIVLGLLAVGVSTVKDWIRGVIFDWLPLLLILDAYGWMRGHADGLLFRPHVLPQLRADEWLGAGIAPSVRLQHALHPTAQLHWWDGVAWLVYMSHFFVPLAVAGALWAVARSSFRQYIAAFLGLTAAGYLTYLLFPAAPPWLAAQEGALTPVTRIVHDVWQSLGAHGIAATFGSRSLTDTNPVAAVPSLHAGYTVLIAAFFWNRTRSAALRSILVAYPIAMGAALVYTGEHYAVDIFLGWAYALSVWALIRRIRRLQPASHGEETS